MLTQAAREQMVEQQVRAWDVLDERVLDTFRQVPRELFVPPEHRYLAYADVAVPLPHGQHMLRPNVAGRLLQALELTGTERALEIGAGTGFLTACLAHSCASVLGVEMFPDLAELAQANLAGLGARNAEVAVADATQLDSGTKYDVIGSPPVMEACLLRCVDRGGWARESLFETVIDPLINARQPDEFTF